MLAALCRAMGRVVPGGRVCVPLVLIGISSGGGGGGGGKGGGGLVPLLRVEPQGTQLEG